MRENRIRFRFRFRTSGCAPITTVTHCLFAAADVSLSADIMLKTEAHEVETLVILLLDQKLCLSIRHQSKALSDGEGKFQHAKQR